MKIHPIQNLDVILVFIGPNINKFPPPLGSCGSCWAFGAVATVESAYYVATETLKDFSEQQVSRVGAVKPDRLGTGVGVSL